MRGGAGTGKTVVALHRARHLANESGGEILLTTFVNNLPKVWERLLAAFPEPVRGVIRCRTVNQIAKGAMHICLTHSSPHGRSRYSA